MTTTDPGPLLVPIVVHGMVLNTTAVTFVRAQMNYTNLASCQSPAPAAFQQDDVNFAHDLRNHGIYLAWTLPDALRHAIEQPDGTLKFPPVPNRWLVVRVYRSSTASATPQTTAWVVESDFVHGTGANFVDPTASALAQIQIGRKVAIGANAPWQETAHGPSFLKAIAESNPAFATYQPFNTNVFSIHDDLTQQQLGAGSLSYYVQGWFSDTGSDPLATWTTASSGPSFADVLKALKWKASAADAGTHATLYHGGVFGIPWQPNAGAPPPSPKDKARPQIAVGNTSVDAVVAFAMAAFDAPNVTPPAGLTPQQAGDLLEAFQYNLVGSLSQPDGQDQLERAIRSQWFGSAPGGTQWTIVDAPLQPGQPPPQPPSAEELAAEAAWLAALNTAQRAFDHTLRDLIGAQRRLFELWWKQNAATVIVEQTGSEPWRTSIDALAAALDPTDPQGPIAAARTLLAKLRELAGQIPTNVDGSLEKGIVAFAAGKHLPPTRELKGIAEPRFWAASDPVVVLSGTASSHAITSDTALLCRWPSEIVGTVHVTDAANGQQQTVASDAVMQQVPGINWTNLPALTPKLFAEWCLLDPTNAVAKSLGAPVAASGSAPAILAPYPWTQPWLPLYLDWDLSWYPVSLTNQTGGANWSFGGIDYDIAGAPSQPTIQSLSGRSVLTPKPSFEFKSRVDQFIADHPDSPAAKALQAVENLVATVDGWDFLSQTLSGLSTQIASWNPVPTLLPPATTLAGGNDTMAELIGQQAQRPPNPLLATPGRVVPPSSFQGARAGQFSFARLAIVDVFGQVLEVVTTQTAPQTRVITGRGLQVTHPVTPINTGGLVQLPPRLLQPARLNFQFDVPASGNPILGWLLPNHIDRGLAVYGSDGVAFGTLAQATNASGAPYVSWWPAPDSEFATPAALAAAHATLGGIVEAIATAGPVALRDLLLSIDETLWTVDPLGDRSDTFLSVLIGRPLAVVDAHMSLELQADVWRDPAWPYTFASPPPDPAFLGVDFAVRLGNVATRQDGLLGYFVDGTWTHCHVVHVPDAPPNTPPVGDYLTSIGPGSWLDLRFAARGPGAPRALTLLMDPRASVHAQCGILPTKDIALVPEWVDHALAAMRVTFRTGPLLGELRRMASDDGAAPTDALLIPAPAERNGTWAWRQLATDNTWPTLTLSPSDANASFPPAAPILRHGVLQLSGGIDE